MYSLSPPVELSQSPQIANVATGMGTMMGAEDEEDPRHAENEEVFQYAQEWKRVDQDQAALRKARQAVRKRKAND